VSWELSYGQRHKNVPKKRCTQCNKWIEDVTHCEVCWACSGTHTVAEWYSAYWKARKRGRVRHHMVSSRGVRKHTKPRQPAGASSR